MRTSVVSLAAGLVRRLTKHSERLFRSPFVRSNELAPVRLVGVENQAAARKLDRIVLDSLLGCVAVAVRAGEDSAILDFKTGGVGIPTTEAVEAPTALINDDLDAVSRAEIFKPGRLRQGTNVVERGCRFASHM